MHSLTWLEMDKDSKLIDKFDLVRYIVYFVY